MKKYLKRLFFIIWLPLAVGVLTLLVILAEIITGGLDDEKISNIIRDLGF